MEEEKRKRFEEAYQSAVEMNRQAWLRGPRNGTEEEANRAVAAALDTLADGGYDVFPRAEWIAKILSDDYAWIGRTYEGSEKAIAARKAVDPEAQKRYDAASLLARQIIKQEWLATGMTEAEWQTLDRRSEAFHLLVSYGYEAVAPPETEDAGTLDSPFAAKELVPQN